MPRQLTDFISGVLVNDGPEERITQVLSRHLVDELGYTKDQIRTRPQWRVPKSPGTARSRGYPVDLIVFRDEASYDDASAAYMIFECKAASHRLTERDEQELKHYLQNEPAARLGVLFNGFGTEEQVQVPKVFYKWIKADGSIEFRELAGFPAAGEPPDLGEAGRLRRELDKAPNLRALFRDIRNYIHSYDSRSRRDEEIIREIVRLLLCKIYDEDRGPDDVLQFRWVYEDTDAALAQRIRNLYSEVRDAYQEIFEEDETDVRLDDASIRYVVTRLQRYEITNSERHAIGDAFEVFIGDALKGKEGQYFTPRNVAELMVYFANPTPKDDFIDPACGTGGFLVSAMGYVYRQIEQQLRSQGRQSQIEKRQHDWARIHLRGIDQDSLCIKFSKAYTALLGDGHTGLFRTDSLEQQRWSAEAQRAIRFGKFDIVLTNPPFGQNLVKNGPLLRDFDLGRKWRRNAEGQWYKTDELQKKQEVGILFLELCLRLLEDGGCLGIVLLEGYLGNQTDGYIPAWLMKNYTVQAVIDLPDTTFQPHTHAKTCVVFVQKTPPPPAHDILMATAKRIGHDDRGNTIYQEDEQFRTRYIDGKPVIADDLPAIQSQLLALRAGQDSPENEFGFRISSQEIENNILIPRYYDRSFVERLGEWAQEHDCDLVSPRDLIETEVIRVFRGHGGMKSQWYMTDGGVPYIRTSNISELEVQYQSRHVVRVPDEIYARVTSRKEAVRANDLLLVRRGEDRIGDVGIVYDGFERILVAGEIDIIRLSKEENEYGLTPFSLLYLISHPLVREQFTHKMFYETIIWNVADRWLDVLLPIPRAASLMGRISGEVRGIVDQRRRGLEQMRDLYRSPALPTSIVRPETVADPI